MSTFTPNINLEEVARNADVGTWDTPTNSNWALTDLVVGGIATIGLNNSNVVLSPAQFQSKTITFNSTLTGSVTITFPTSFTKSYEIQNLCTGSSAFTITLETTAASGQLICCPPGEIVDVVNDGSNIKFKNLGRVGSYWDYAGSSVPAWVSACTVPPYLNCDGSGFSGVTYPVLALVLAGTTLPNSKGKARFTLDQSAGLLSSAVTGFSPNTVGASGGAQNITIGSSNLPANIPYKDPGHVHPAIPAQSGIATTDVSGGHTVTGTANSGSATIGITINPSTAAAGTGNAFAAIPPAYIGGLTLIRAA